MPELGIRHARIVRQQIGWVHPTEIDIDVMAHMRGVLVRSAPTAGARASLIRLNGEGVIGVAAGLPSDQRRWAIAHELGHFEVHVGVSYLGLCTGEDLRTDYDQSGREQEANAFAAELLMPSDLFGSKCDFAKVTWGPVVDLASEFQVSVTAAALRMLAFTYDRVAVVASRDSKVVWSQSTKDFGPRLRKGAALDKWSLAYDFHETGKVSPIAETVTADAWVPGARGEAELVEHVLPMPNLRMALSLLSWPPG